MENGSHNKIPRHIAVIMDGNGRWAAKRHMPRSYGHQQGSRAVERFCENAYELGIKYVTVYAFSTENWSRPQDEIDTLMGLLRDFLKDCIKKSKKNNMRVRILGDVTRLDSDLRQRITELTEKTKEYDGLQFQVALNYGGRDEILRAVKKLFAARKETGRETEEITEAEFRQFLDSADIPDPDLIIRTSGEQRMSNFLLWESAYSELYFTEVLWPDFDRKELEKVLEHYAKRERRFGGV